MAEFIRQYDWGFLEVVVTLVIAFLSVLWALYERGRSRERNRKKLHYVVKTLEPLVVFTQQDERLTILFDGKEIPNAYVATVELRNPGPPPIASSDFETHLSIQFGPAAEILSYEVLSDGLPIDAVQVGGQIDIQPLLLNEGDTFEVRVIGVSFSEEVQVTGRILGVKQIELVEPVSAADFREFLLEVSPGWLSVVVPLIPWEQLFQRTSKKRG